MDDRRYYGLDALRGTLMMLGIVLHSAMFYVTEPAIPLPTDHNTAHIFDLMLLFIHSFRMQAFFVLAGFFTSLLVAKRGVLGTYRDRVRRVLGPLVVGSLTILPVTAVLSADFLLSARYGTRDLIPDPGALKTAVQELVDRGAPLDQPSLGHLWFLEDLCFFYLLIPLCIVLVRYSLSIQSSLTRYLGSPYVLIPFGLYTAAILWPFHGGQLLLENTLLKPHLPSLIYFGSFFVLGYVFHHYRDFLPTLARRVATWAMLAVLLLPLAGYTSLLDIKAHGDNFGFHLGAVLANGLFTWTLIFLFMGSALRFFDRESPWIQYASQSAYWVFLVHLPLVCLSAWWLIQFDLPAIFKFLVDCVFALVIALVTFHYWVQKTWISDFLHGRRFDLDWPWRRPRGGNLNGGRRRTQRPGGY